ncbi:WecB/TagA/CpsF family glycosyltransferase [Actinoalloteichus caeruleus]|uniref:Polymer biosynthesis protein, WecB/TagA/CpsF family n=1 Tax=Actinoalloteichus caeruleus DSM 43889 TaxID=1120930 RepID=A0ABT1JL83_ACTCY|nr:WecB/TagA/CpsF family glycosyltransferase [Actinoalloteichus caeruleus]MCP2333273.1 polymer biosynthesis protein, WecB/TagA/CpsF family [Actinoalloteichus caeruleus DSM 43889]
MRASIPTTSVLGVPVANLSVPDAIAETNRLLNHPEPAVLCFVNAHSANLAHRDPAYRRTLLAADLVLNDGSGVELAARLQGTRFRANLNGTDLIPLVLDLAACQSHRVFLLGGRPGVARSAASALAGRHLGLRVVGHAHGYFPPGAARSVADAVRASGADLLVLGLGSPAQELFLAAHLRRTGVRLGIAGGAFLDFAAGRVPRAPRWMREAGVEWVFRLGQEPGRLFHRYVVGNPLFLARVVRERCFPRRTSQLPAPEISEPPARPSHRRVEQ